MTEEVTTEGTAEETVAKTSEPKPEGKTYDQAALDDITNKKVASRDKTIAKLEADNAAMRQQNETEQEASIRKATEEADARADVRVAKVERDNTIALALTSEGVPALAIPGLVGLAGETGEPADAVAILKATYAPMFGKQNQVANAGGVQGEAKPAVDHSPTYIDAELEKLHNAADRTKWLQEHNTEIEDWRRRNGFGGSRSIAPGTGLHAVPETNKGR